MEGTAANRRRRRAIDGGSGGGGSLTRAIHRVTGAISGKKC